MKKAKVTALLLSASIMSGLCFQNVYADDGNKALFTRCFDGNKNEKLTESGFENILEYETHYKKAGVLYLYKKDNELYVGVTHPDYFLDNYGSVFSAASDYGKIYIFKSQNRWFGSNKIVSFAEQETEKIKKLYKEKIEIITATYVEQESYNYKLGEANEAKEEAEKNAKTANEAKEKAVKEVETAKKAKEEAEENAKTANEAKDKAVKEKKSAIRDKYVVLATSGIFVALENLYLIFQDEVAQAYNWSKGLVSHCFNLLKNKIFHK